MSNIDRYTQFISEQVRSERVIGLRSINVEESTEVTEVASEEPAKAGKKPLSARTAAKHERASLEKHFGGEFKSGQHGRGPQTQHIMHTGMSGDEMHKKLTSAGYKPYHWGTNNQFGGRQKAVSKVTGRMTDTGRYHKTDEHGHEHHVMMYHDDRQNTIQHGVV